MATVARNGLHRRIVVPRSKFRPGTRRVNGIMIALPFHRLPADVAAAEAFRPVDAVDRLIGALLRFGDGLAGRADVQHAAAIGEDVAVLRNRAGVEDLDALDLGGVVEPLDARALARSRRDSPWPP